MANNLERQQMAVPEAIRKDISSQRRPIVVEYPSPHCVHRASRDTTCITGQPWCSSYATLKTNAIISVTFRSEVHGELSGNLLLVVFLALFLDRTEVGGVAI